VIHQCDIVSLEHPATTANSQSTSQLSRRQSLCLVLICTVGTIGVGSGTHTHRQRVVQRWRDTREWHLKLDVHESHTLSLRVVIKLRKMLFDCRRSSTSHQNKYRNTYLQWSLRQLTTLSVPTTSCPIQLLDIVMAQATLPTPPSPVTVSAHSTTPLSQDAGWLNGVLSSFETALVSRKFTRALNICYTALKDIARSTPSHSDSNDEHDNDRSADTCNETSTSCVKPNGNRGHLFSSTEQDNDRDLVDAFGPTGENHPSRLKVDDASGSSSSFRLFPLTHPHCSNQRIFVCKSSCCGCCAVALAHS
jgi:hypothetical protein